MTNPCEDCRRACTDPCWKVDHGLLVEAPRWIPVTERLPEKDKYVWCYSNKNGGYMFRGYRGYISGDWMEGGSLHIGDVTHWMPLPEVPKEDDHDS